MNELAPPNQFEMCRIPVTGYEFAGGASKAGPHRWRIQELRGQPVLLCKVCGKLAQLQEPEPT